MPRILVVEDDPPVRRLIGEVLADAGYDVQLATDAREGLRDLHQSRPDAIVLDFLMPGMDGMDFLLERRHDPAAAGVPVVLVSTASQAVETLIGTLGVTAAVPKPFDLSELVSVVTHSLQNT